MMRCLIIDDEPLAREGIELLVTDVPYLELAGAFSDPVKALDALQNDRPDLLFLDIEMPGMSGLEFLESVRDAPLVILTTAYPQYALKSYELDVVDYLVKPVRMARFFKAVEKARNLFELRQRPQNPAPQPAPEPIFIKADRQYHQIELDDILFIEGMKDYVRIHLHDKKLTTAMNLKTIQQQLPEQLFARINKSAIINIRHIRSVDIENIYLEGFPPFALGRSYKEEFLKKYIEGKSIKR